MGLGDLLKAVSGDEDDKEKGAASQADALGGILGGLVGGQGSVSELGGLVGGLLGGSDAGGLAGILSAASGGDLTANPLIAPIVQGLSAKLGLSPEIAQIVVSFVMAKVLPALTGGTGAAATATGAASGSSGADSQTELDLDDLLSRLGSRQPLGHEYLASSGMPEELAEETGLDAQMAEKSLQEAFLMVGEAIGGGSRE